MNIRRERAVEKVSIDDVTVPTTRCRRNMNVDVVATLAESIRKVGLRHPIWVRYIDAYDEGHGELIGAYVLVTGQHRLEACRSLGMTEIDCIVDECDEDEARMWEIAENLHRADLTALERSEHVAEWVKLSDKLGQLVQVSGGRGREGGLSKASRELNLGRKDAERSVKVAGLSAEAKEAAREAGLDDNRTALLAAAKGATPQEQTEKIVKIANEKASRQSKVDGDVKQRAARALAEWIVEHAEGNDLDAVKANLFAVGAKSVAIELTNLLGESIMDRRYAHG